MLLLAVQGASVDCVHFDLDHKVCFGVDNYGEGHYHRIDVVLAGWLVLILAVGKDRAHQHGVVVVHTLEDIYLEEAVVVDLVLEEDTVAEEDTAIERNSFE